MPTYTYKCTDCDARYNIKHGFHSEKKHFCNSIACVTQPELKKVITPTPVHWRNGTFYNKGNDLK